jgi:hypothetical protein
VHYKNVNRLNAVAHSETSIFSTVNFNDATLCRTSI